jgi:hypothetical protein
MSVAKVYVLNERISIEHFWNHIDWEKNIPKSVIFVILPVVLYGCETWSLTLREESRLRVFKNRVLGRIFGPKRDDMTGEW